MRISNLRSLLIVCGFLCLGSVPVPSRAQGDGARPQARKKPLTYDDRIGSSEAEQWHLEEFRELLLKEPDAQVFIVAYNGRDDAAGKARRYALRAKNYLVNSRGIDPRRIFTIEGGRREEFIVELWLVPKGSKPPEPAPTITVQDDPGDNLLYDSYNPGYEGFGNYHEGTEGRLGGFAAALKKEATAWGCVIVYAQNGDDKMGIEWDSPRTAQDTSRSVKNYLVRKHGFNASRISAVDGGYSETRMVELWIMRPGARFDSGPFVYAGRLKAVRDKTLTIDNSVAPGVCCKACVRDRAKPRNSPQRARS